MARTFVACGDFDPAPLTVPAQACDGEFTITGTPDEALQLIQMARPAAVIADGRRPGMDLLVRSVRADAGIDETPVIVALPAADDKQIAEALGYGADDFLVHADLGVTLASKLHAACVPPEVRTTVPPRATLLLEPSAIHRPVFERLLGEGGFQPTTVATEDELARMLASYAFELIVADVGAPGAAVAIAKLAHDATGGQVPPMLGTVTAATGRDTIEQALAQGFSGMHDKRRPPEELVFLASEAVEGRLHRAQVRAQHGTLAYFRTAADMYWHLGFTHNFSEGGVFVRTIEIPAIGEVVDLKLALGGRQVEVQGCVTWRKDFAARTIRSYPTGMGVAFTNLTDAQRATIAQAAATLGAKPA